MSAPHVKCEFVALFIKNQRNYTIRRNNTNLKNRIMFSKSSNLLTQADIKSLEEIVGYSLPTDFINQYLHFNGGVADKTYFYVEDDDGYVEVSFFIPIKYPSTDLGNIDIATSYSHLVSKRIPNKYLPFAVDWGGNLFSIDLETNKIVLLLMDLGDFTEESIKYLTKGFLNFMKALEEEGDDEEDL